MSTKLAGTDFESVGDLLASLGSISPDRVRMKPTPGRATARDVVRLRTKTRRLYELVDGTLVEKILGVKESFVAVCLSTLVSNYSEARGNLGMVLGADGPFKLMDKLVRIPDVSFTNWDRVPDRRVPDEPVPELAPDLAVEILSEGNTREEMDRKLKEYFLSEVALVWFIDPRKRTVRVFTSPDDVTELSETDTLDGGDVLPGFEVEVGQLFEQLRPAPKSVKSPKSGGAKKPKKRK
ncbi:hypothetical protein VT84_15465 [Gemmata sp. SH-PL17]|uniref:Uma2 family endonuclease n=1 Tax=Gemmata sp. SH-PL17 TaxID=1630693 RepID=UPI00078D43CC|nr:Uma2 family endonuclease [Gemmata sp. SH-PL17]AMV25795.1 hypothetical protein VT84_15465 [Gemmata sp. SH-PL17]